MIEYQQHVVVPEVRKTVSTTEGYRFNYLPVNEPFRPEVFASRVGEHGVYRGNRY